MKSTVEEIRQRFDADERFSNLGTGQSATVDAPRAMGLIAQVAAVTTPHARHVLDVCCRQLRPQAAGTAAELDATLIDLSQPMLDRARERVGGDIWEVELPDEQPLKAVFRTDARQLLPGSLV